MSEQNLFEVLNYQRKLLWQKWQLAKIDIGSAFNRVNRIKDIKLQGDYPVSLKEVFNEDAHFYSCKLRNEARFLVSESPSQFAEKIKSLLNTRFDELNGKTPHMSIVDNPERKNYLMLQRLIRQKADKFVYGLE